MRKLIVPLLGCLAGLATGFPATAQQVDNSMLLPDAQPGECYAKVITPPLFEVTTEEVVIQEASERIETVEAVYKSNNKTMVVKEASDTLELVEATFDAEVERIEVRAVEQIWTSSMGDQSLPTSPATLAQIAQSGVNLEEVTADSCFVEYYNEAKYETKTEQVLVKPAMETISIVPAKFETVEERIVIKEASTQIVDVPAVYRTESESVLVEPARNVWQHCGLVERSDKSAGEIMCMVKVPERYETLTKTVLDKPATSKTISIPAVYETVEVQRLIEPAKEMRKEQPAEYETIAKRVRSEEPVFFWLAKDAQAQADAKPTGRTTCLETQPAELVAIEKLTLTKPASVVASPSPAEYETITVQELVSAATERRIVIPARTRTVTSRQETASGTLEWRQVLCETDMTPQKVLSIQRALAEAGFNPGPIDGIIGRATLDAMERYQSENNLGRGGITFESMEKLGVQSAS